MLSHSIYHLGRIIHTYRVVTDTGFDYYSEHEAIFTLNFVHVESIHWPILKRYLTSTLFSKICIDYKPSTLESLHLFFVTIRDLFSAICMEYKSRSHWHGIQLLFEARGRWLSSHSITSMLTPFIGQISIEFWAQHFPVKKIVYKPRHVDLRFVWYHLYGV